jgi:hypothetical protein
MCRLFEAWRTSARRQSWRASDDDLIGRSCLPADRRAGARAPADRAARYLRVELYPDDGRAMTTTRGVPREKMSTPRRA